MIPAETPEASRARVIAQVIRRIIPFAFICYVVAYIDRVNVGFALEAGSGTEETMRLITNDLSTFGLSISGGPTPKKGTRLSLKLFLPDEPTTPLVLEAEVLGPLGRDGGVRMKFLKPELEAVRRIHKLVK